MTCKICGLPFFEGCYSYSGLVCQGHHCCCDKPISETQKECTCTRTYENKECFVTVDGNCPIHGSGDEGNPSPKPIEGIEMPIAEIGMVPGMRYESNSVFSTEQFKRWMQQITTQTNLNTTAIKNMRRDL